MKIPTAISPPIRRNRSPMLGGKRGKVGLSTGATKTVIANARSSLARLGTVESPNPGISMAADPIRANTNIMLNNSVVRRRSSILISVDADDAVYQPFRKSNQR